MYDPVSIQIPFTLLYFAMGTFGIFSYSIKQLMFEENERRWIYFNWIGLLIIFSLCIYRSYTKLEKINDLISKNELVTVEGKVTGLFHARNFEYFYIEKQKFKFYYTGNTYCFNYKNEVLDNQSLQITYVDISRKSKHCILSVKSIDPSKARIIYDPWGIAHQE